MLHFARYAKFEIEVDKVSFTMKESSEFKEFMAASGVAPVPAGVHLEEYAKLQGYNAYTLSKKIDCAPSTLRRLFTGAALSIEMAAKIERHIGLSARFLFNLEAEANAYKAEQMVKGYEESLTPEIGNGELA